MITAAHALLPYTDRTWRVARLLLPLVFLVLASTASAVDLARPVRIESGLLQGVPDPATNVVSFKGVPYAAPPVGDLRWREPQPPLPWNDVRVADRFGAICPQLTFGSDTPASGASEDCLFLNLWAPAKADEEKLPILLFVHGGMYQFGSGNLNGDGLAKKGIIFITVNCRLGRFCSTGHPELTKESPLKACANYGSLDLIAALQWIQRNIAAFGGDPTRVTISGQSTGASNVHYLTASPLAKGLFHRLIAISFPYEFLMKPDAIGTQWQAEQGGLALAKAHGFTSLRELRGLPVTELLKGGGGPTYATAVYPQNYPTALRAGLVSDVPTLTGMTVDDFGPPAKFDPYTDLSWFKKRIARKCPADKLDQVLAQYPAKTDAEARAMWKLVGNEFRMADIFYWAKERAKTAKTPVYTYLFTHAQAQEPEKGAYHGSDLFYEFNDVYDPGKRWSDVDRRVAEQVSSYWVNFVRTGDPNGTGLAPWKAFDATDPSTMHLGETSLQAPIANTMAAWNLLHQR